MQYFIIENGKQTGPLTLDQLNQKGITSDTLVWAEGMQDWTPAWKIDEIRPILDGKYTSDMPNQNDGHTLPPGMPPIPDHITQQQGFSQADAQQGYSQQQDIQPAPQLNYGEQPYGQQAYSSNDTYEVPQPANSSKKTWIIIGIVIVLLFGFMTCSNPDKEDHKRAIKTELNEAISKSINNSANISDGNDIISQGLNALTRMFTGPIIDAAIDELVEYDNYVVFSKTTITLGEKKQTISYGFMNKVWTVDSEDIVKAIEEYNPLNGNNDKSSIFGNDNEEDDDDEESMNGNSDDTDEEESRVLSPSGKNDDDINESVKKHLNQKANEAAERIVDRVSERVSEKVNEKIDEMTDSSTVDRLIDKILSLF